MTKKLNILLPLFLLINSSEQSSFDNTDSHLGKRKRISTEKKHNPNEPSRKKRKLNLSKKNLSITHFNNFDEKRFIQYYQSLYARACKAQGDMCSAQNYINCLLEFRDLHKTIMEHGLLELENKERVGRVALLHITILQHIELIHKNGLGVKKNPKLAAIMKNETKKYKFLRKEAINIAKAAPIDRYNPFPLSYSNQSQTTVQVPLPNPNFRKKRALEDRNLPLKKRGNRNDGSTQQEIQPPPFLKRRKN